MRFSHLLVFGCLALAACGSRPPREPSPYTTGYRPPRDENYHGGPNAMLLKYATNPDGSLTKAQLNTGLHADFDKYDTAHKGCLTPDQVAAINAERIAADQSTATPLQDFRQDGCVDFREFAAAPLSLFDQLDRDGNGIVTPQEFNPKPRPGDPAGPGGPDGGRGRRGGSPP